MNRLKRKEADRPRAFWGALISAGLGVAGALLNSSAQKKQRRLQANLEDYNNSLEEAQGMTNALNAGQDYQQNYLQQFKQQARLGTTRRLGSRNIMITDGGNAKRIGNNTYLLRGGSHEDINETGQTGIGINVGGNEIEAEGGEVAQRKGNSLRIYSAQPILGGISPAQAIMRGYDKDKVFNAQQRFKKNNGIKDDGSKAAFGNLITMPFASIVKDVVDYFSNSGKYAPKRVKVSNKTVNRKPIRNGQVGNFRVVNGRHINNEKPLRQVYPEFDIISMGIGLPVGKAVKATAKAAKNKVSYINRISKSRLYSDNPIVNTYATYARRYNLPDKARVPYMIRRVKSDELPYINNGRITMSGGRFKHTNFTYDRPVVSHRKGKWDTAQQTYLINGRRLVSENKGNWGSIEPSDMFTIQDPKGGLTIPTKDVILVSGHKGLLGKAKASGIKIATSPQLQRIEKIITPKQSLGRFNLAGAERRHYNTPYWIDVNNIVKEYGTPKLKDVRLLEEITGLKSGVSKLNNNAIKIINDAKGFNKLSLNEAEQVMNQTYPNGRVVNFTNDREAYVTSQLPYNNLFYDPTTYAESNYVFPKRFGGRCKLRNGGLTSKDRGSSKHPYPSVPYKDFAGSGRSYPIPTKADAIDALRLAGLHGRSDVRSKVYSKYPELRKKARGGTKVEPYYDWARNTSSNLGISFIDPTYDYRTYYNSVTPYERNLIRFAPQGTHFTDIGKTPKHPTFSNESIYSNKKHPGGTWNGNVFVPNIWQFGNDGNKARNKYMNNSEEGYFNGKVNIFPKYRKRITKRMGCLTNPPVERFKCGGRIRPKAEDGMLTPIYSYGIDRRRFPSFAPIDVTPRAIPNFKPVSVPTNTKTPFDPNSIPYLGKQSSFKPTTQDYIGLGIDTLASLGIGLINSSAASKTYLPERPAIIQASKLPTYYNVAPQVEEVKRQRDILNGEIANNTSSSVAALNRISRIRGIATGEINKLYATKENEENKMLTQDALNQQQVAAENAKLQADYETNKANILNAASQAKANALSGTLSGLSQAWTNFASSVENRYNTRQNEAIIAATAKDPAVLSNAIEFGYNFSPEILAGIYNSTKDENLKDLVLSQLNNKNRRKYGIK